MRTHGYPVTRFRPKKAVQRDISDLVEQLRTNAKTGLHLGCGGHLIDGLTNCDQFNPAADMKVNATDLSPFANGSIDYIESNHMIEHLSFSEASQAFAEWARVLSPTGYVVITCPDFSGLIARWNRSSSQENWSKTIQMIYGSQEHSGMFHRSAFNRQTLTVKLEDVGLKVVFGFSPFPRRPTPSLIVIAQRASRK